MAIEYTGSLQGKVRAHTPETLAATWLNAYVVLPNAGGAPKVGTVEEFKGETKAYPAVVFCHGSSGVNPQIKIFAQWLADALRVAVVVPDSMQTEDLTVGLADDATWEGASSKTEDGIEFIANVPTEEVFCAPHRERTNGIVYGTKPYAYNGQLIEGWHVTFKDGVVVEHGAEKNADLLAELLSTDENSNRIGEIALVPASSPINRSGVLFYNTLFDENAACHIAFGAGYPTNIRGGSAMTRDDLMKKGLNNSAIHEDVMIGAADTHVTGITKRGEEVTIFENGEWAF